MLNNSSIPKKIFIALSTILVILLPLLAIQSGPNGDEDVESVYGKDIYNYWANGDPQALNYDNHELGMHIKFMEYYGGLVNLLGEASNRWFGVELIASRHIFVGIFGALMMIFTGLLAYRLSKNNWWTGLLGLLFIVFSPRLFGESFHNGKDIPYAASVIMIIYCTIRLLDNFGKINKKFFLHLIGLAFALIIGFGSRPAGGILVVAYSFAIIFFYFVFNPSFRKIIFDKKNLRYLLIWLVSYIVGYGFSLIFWPYGLQSPISNLFTALAEMSNRDTNFRMFFEGAYLRTKDVPWYYTLKWIMISSPIIALVSFIGFVLAGFSISKKYSNFTVVTIIFCALFPIIYTIIKESTLLDTWRHSFFVFPFWAVGASLFIGWISSLFKNPKFAVAPIAIAIVCLTPEIIWTATTTPYQSIYFNALVGGIQGAQDQYELDYYQLSGKEIRDWMQSNAKPREGNSAVIFKSNMDAIFIDKNFMDDTTKIKSSYGRYYERHTFDWDYFATFGRFIDEWQLKNHTWITCDAVYKVELKGVPLAAILHRNSNHNYLASLAINEKNYEEAVKQYELADKNGGLCNDSELFYYALTSTQLQKYDQAIDALQRAIKINGEMPEYYEVLSHVYASKQDMANADKYQKVFQSIKATKALKK